MMMLTVDAISFWDIFVCLSITFRDLMLLCENAKYLFGLEAEDRLLGFFYIGHTAVPSPAAKRKSIDEKVIWVNS